MADQNPKWPEKDKRKRKLSKKLHKVLSIDFSKAHNENEKKKTRQLYKKQCKKLVIKENQESLIKVLTIGRLYKIPFLLLLVDCYTRDRFDEYIKKLSLIANTNNDHKTNNKKTSKTHKTKSKTNIALPSHCNEDFLQDHNILTVSQWTKQFIKIVSLKNKTIQKIGQDIEASIDLMFKRYAGKFMFTQSVKIKDDRLRFANYALAGAYFVDRLVERERAIPPFQIDFMILPSQTKSVFNKKFKRRSTKNLGVLPQSKTGAAKLFPEKDDGDDEKKNDDESDDDDDDISFEAPLKRYESHSDLGNEKRGLMFIQNLSKGDYSIESRLKDKGCVYDMDIEKDGISNQPNRLFYQFYGTHFSNEMGKKYNKGMSHTDKLKYPHGKRISIVINRWRDYNKIKERLEDKKGGRDMDDDIKSNSSMPGTPKSNVSKRKLSGLSTGSGRGSRRGSKKKKKARPDKIYMFEPDKNETFPKNFVSEWGLDAAFTSIIPSFGDKKNEKSPEKRSVGASDTGEGYVFVLSFQICSKHEIRCYCCYGGQMFRFMASDITTTWLQIFDEEKFVKMSKSSSDKYKKMYEHRNKELRKIQQDLRKLMITWDVGFDNFRQLAKYNPDQT